MRDKSLLIFCIGLMIFMSLYCSRKGEQQSAGESKVTLLCRKANEQSVFRDGRPTMFLMFIPLVDWDAENQPQPRLLESWEHSQDYTDWTFHLRQDVKWHNGNPVTAHDVKFTLELLADPNIMYEHRVFEEITIIDNFTCHIRSNTPFNALIYSWYGVCPKHLLEGLDTAKFYSWDFWKQPVGSGPYRYVRHLPDVMVELEANPDYYGEKPKIERVVLKFGENPFPELLSGNVDAVNNIFPLEIIKLAQNPNFDIYHNFEFNRVFTIVWNHKNPLFQSAALRRALTLAVNRQELKQLLNLPESTPIFDVATSRGHVHRGEVPPPLPYDPAQAKKILEEAGWMELEKDGVRKKKSQEFRFSLLVSARLMTEAVYIQDQLNKVGIRMEINTMERSVWKHRAKSGEFDAILCSILPFHYLGYFGGYDNPEFMRLLETAYKSPSTDAFDSNVRNIWPIFQKDLPLLFLYPGIYFNIVHKRIKGLKKPRRTDPARFMEHLWIEEEE